MNVHYLFVDMNSYFASVEQQLQPRLRGRPIAVVPVMAETSCCIAASYEAKRFGIKTGTSLREARQRCPEIVFILARTRQYVEFQEEIQKAVESVLHIDRVHSVDEMSCRLVGRDREYDRAWELGKAVKQAVKQQIGEAILCSVGLAPNCLLAKVASNMQKPDGLTLIRNEDLPELLYSLKLNDFPGIGRRMLARFQQAGIHTVEEMYRQPKSALRDLWGGVLGERWWHLIRGEDLVDKPTQRRTVGHSHVLAPEYRNDPLAYEVLIKLTHKAAVRLRDLHYWAGQLTIQVSYRGRDYGYQNWSATAKLGDVQDTQSMLQAVAALWGRRPRQGVPTKMEVVLHALKSAASCSLPLFPEQQRRLQAAKAMDAINKKMGEGALYLGAMHHARQAAPDRIAFQSIPQPRQTHPSIQSMGNRAEGINPFCNPPQEH